MSALLVPVLIRNAARIVRMPLAWDSDYWALFLDAAFLLAMSKAAYKHVDIDFAVLYAAPVVKALLAMFYFASGFWKVNTSFLSPRTSCGSIFTASLLVQLWPDFWGDIPTSVAHLAVQIGPWITVVGECATGLLLAMPGKSSTLLGLCSMLLLHLGISFTAYPNGIANFSYTAATRYYFLVPHGASRALGELLAVPRSTWGYVGRAAAALAIAIAWHCGRIAGPQHAGAVFFSTMGVIYTRAVHAEVAEPPTSPACRLGLMSGIYVAIVAFFVFGAQVLGLMDLSAPASPFSSIRVHGGSNHFILPTGLLQAWAVKSSINTTGAGSLEGGIVRVEYTDSVWINSLYPSESTLEIRPKIVAVLRQGGHLGRQFNPTPRRILGPELRAFMPRWKPGDGAFLQYTVPAMELRRLVSEARESGENFTLVYVQLHGTHGDEAWRASAEGRRVELNVSGGIEHCSSDGQPCSNELVQLPRLDYMSMKTRIFFPYPIIADAGGELPCMD